MAMNQAFFNKYAVELSEKHALKHIVKQAEKIYKLCSKEEPYASELIELKQMIADFEEATM